MNPWGVKRVTERLTIPEANEIVFGPGRRCGVGGYGGAAHNIFLYEVSVDDISEPS